MAYRFGPFQLDPLTGTLTGPAGPVPLRRRAFRLAEVLLEHAPELLDHNTLLDQVWGRTALSANALPQTISELRHALGDDAHHPRFIETVHRRGYRIICPVDRIDARRLSGVGARPGARVPGPPIAGAPPPLTTGGFVKLGVLLLAMVLMVASTPSRPDAADPARPSPGPDPMLDQELSQAMLRMCARLPGHAGYEPTPSEWPLPDTRALQGGGLTGHLATCLPAR